MHATSSAGGGRAGAARRRLLAGASEQQQKPDMVRMQPCQALQQNVLLDASYNPSPHTANLQYKPQTLYDFRAAPSATRGYKVGITKLGRQGTKRKLEEYAEQVGGGDLAGACCWGWWVCGRTELRICWWRCRAPASTSLRMNASTWTEAAEHGGTTP